MQTLKVLLAGSSGFVGTNFLRYVAQYLGIEVRCLSRIDLNEGNYQLPDIDTVVHLAGKAHDLKRVSDPSVYYDVNFELTKKFYNAFLKSNASKFIFISSVKAVADSVDNILTENVIPNPQTHYGKSKLIAEEYIQSRDLPEGKSYYILRPCMIHGPGNKGNLNLLFKFVSKGLPYPLAAFENKRSFLSVENLCFIIKELIEHSNLPSGVYNVADDEELSTNQIVSLLSEGLNKSPRLLHVPVKLISFAARIGDSLNLPLNTERLRKLTENYIVSNSKIKAALQVDRLPISSREGFSITLKSFLR